MKADPELAPLVDNHEVTVWMGPGRHIVAYCIVCLLLAAFTEIDHIHDCRRERLYTISL